MSARRPPVGTEWRTLVGGKGSEPRISTLSRDYARSIDTSRFSRSSGVSETILDKRTTFDEVVIRLGGGVIHIEDMGSGTYYVGLGDEKRMVWVDKTTGKIVVGEMYK